MSNATTLAQSRSPLLPLDGYLVTFTSLAIILLSFFIFLDAQTKPSTERRERTTLSLKKNFVPSQQPAELPQKEIQQPVPVPTALQDTRNSAALSAIYNSLVDMRVGEVFQKESLLEIKIAETQLFENNSLTSNAVNYLRTIVKHTNENDLKLDAHYSFQAPPAAKLTINTKYLEESFTEALTRTAVLHRLLVDAKLSTKSFQISSGVNLDQQAPSSLNIILTFKE